MRNGWNRGAAVLAAAAFFLVIGMNAGRAMAYFTAYVTAEGGKVLELGFTTTDVEEYPEIDNKRIFVRNTGDWDCYVRVKLFAGASYGLDFDTTSSDSRWTEGADGYYYWTEVLPAGGNTEVLKVDIDNSGAPASADSYTVIVVQEYTPVPCDGEGNVIPWDGVDWSREVDVVKSVEE